MFGFCIFTQIPIALVKDITILHKLSKYGTYALLYSVLVSIIEFPFYFKQNYSFEKLKFFDLNINVIKVICMYVFSYANHNAILNVINELQSPSREKGEKIRKYSYFIEFFIYSTILYIGYFSTFDETNEIFIDRPGESAFMIVGKGLYIISLTCHIGLFYFISKPSMSVIINNGLPFTNEK
jgi:amino acid permease